MKRKNITITDEQAEWVKERSINLSRFVQRALEKEMRKSGKGGRKGKRTS